MTNQPEPLPEQDVVLGTVVLTKVMLPNGEIKYREMTSETLHPIEILGMVTSFTQTLNRVIAGGTFQRGEP